jgi:hypothetical protein
MSEKRFCFITHAGRDLGVDIARDEPSHIHLPRRRRVARPVDQDNNVAGGDAEYRATAFALDARQPTRNRG